MLPLRLFKRTNMKDSTEEPLRIFLFGTGESGKTTIFNQLTEKLNFGHGSTYTGSPMGRNNAERDDQSNFEADDDDLLAKTLDGKTYILTNVVKACAGVIKRCHFHDQNFTYDNDAASLGEEMILDLNSTQSPHGISEVGLRPDVAAAIIAILNDKNVHATLNASYSKYQNGPDKNDWYDNWEYFAERLLDYPNWGGADWLPSMQDCMMFSPRTTGITTETIGLSGVQIKYVDTGGQKPERRKWPSLYPKGTTDKVSYVFVASVSEYDKVLFENESVCRLVDSFDCFQMLTKSLAEKGVRNITLILNKVDLLDEKLITHNVSLNVSGKFPNAPIKVKNVEVALDWIKEEFLKRSSITNVIIHKCTALNPSSTREVFRQIEDDLVNRYTIMMDSSDASLGTEDGGQGFRLRSTILARAVSSCLHGLRS